ncbi:hypothetical protein SCV_gp3 [Starling circovirus]|uniref:Uncharacterized protein n=1 Tax=Starling circovirus TaxID=349370 RepID=Q1L2D3_9CIRC|nr:hypothetical protein SCV_gp3 [Starling circovirus]ABB59614.1 unknown [Starling circovirus]
MACVGCHPVRGCTGSDEEVSDQLLTGNGNDVTGNDDTRDLVIIKNKTGGPGGSPSPPRSGGLIRALPPRCRGPLAVHDREGAVGDRSVSPGPKARVYTRPRGKKNK